MIQFDLSLHKGSFRLQAAAEFQPGITGIYGPSGAGKTTLLHCLSGIKQPDKGSINIQGKVLFSSAANVNLPPEKRGIALVFQDAKLFPHLNVKQNLLYGYSPAKTGSPEWERLCALFDLSSHLAKRPRDLSGGEKQRVALGRALLSTPGALLLDEPFSGVDVEKRRQLITYLQEAQRNINIPMVVVSHELPDLLTLVDRICVLQEGQIIAHDTYPGLLQSPQFQTFFGASHVLNELRVRVKPSEMIPGITELELPGLEQGRPLRISGSVADLPPGSSLKLHIPSQEIALSLQELQDVSIQNQLPGTISEILPSASGKMVKIDIQDQCLLVEVTRDSCEKLRLRAGLTVWCLFKAVLFSR